MKANAGAVYTVYNQYLKRYTACQVAYIAPPDSVSKEPWAVILSLDWVGDAPLTAEELPHLRPLYKDFMYWPRDLHLLRVPIEVPPQYTLVGTLPPFTDQPCRSYGGWSGWRKIWTIPSGAGTARSISLPLLRKKQPINTARPVLS